MGPARALEWVRLRRASVLLSRGSMPVQEIARAVGYVDQYHFSRRFRTTFGRSPTGFRAASAGDQAAALPGRPAAARAGAVRRDRGQQPARSGA
jgi:AraC-like DNA-binding protein